MQPARPAPPSASNTTDPSGTLSCCASLPVELVGDGLGAEEHRVVVRWWLVGDVGAVEHELWA